MTERERLIGQRILKEICENTLSGEPITAQTVQQMVDAIQRLPVGAKFQVLAPIVRGRKGEYRKELLAARRAGFVRARVDGKIFDLGETISLEKQRKHTIEIIVDRLMMKEEESLRRRLADSVDTALKLAQGLVGILTEDGALALYSEKLACITCGVSYPEITPRVFSFNSPHGDEQIPHDARRVLCDILAG